MKVFNIIPQLSIKNKKKIIIKVNANIVFQKRIYKSNKHAYVKYNIFDIDENKIISINLEFNETMCKSINIVDNINRDLTYTLNPKQEIGTVECDYMGNSISRISKNECIIDYCSIKVKLIDDIIESFISEYYDISFQYNENNFINKIILKDLKNHDKDYDMILDYKFI